MYYDVGTTITFKKQEPKKKEKALLVCWFLPGTRFFYDTFSGNMKPQTA